MMGKGGVCGLPAPGGGIDLLSSILSVEESTVTYFKGYLRCRQNFSLVTQKKKAQRTSGQVGLEPSGMRCWTLLVVLLPAHDGVHGMFAATDDPPPPDAGVTMEPSKSPKYTGCMSGFYGSGCEGECACDNSFADCDDGPSGHGGCSCHAGKAAETACQHHASSANVPPIRRTSTPLTFIARTLDALDVDLEVSRGAMLVFERIFPPKDAPLDPTIAAVETRIRVIQ
jgi:hypothetical protein